MKRLALSRLYLARGRAPEFLPGEDCPERGCMGVLKVYTTKWKGEPGARVKVQYLHCPLCGAVPQGNKVIIPEEYTDPHRPRRKSAGRGGG